MSRACWMTSGPSALGDEIADRAMTSLELPIDRLAIGEGIVAFLTASERAWRARARENRPRRARPDRRPITKYCTKHCIRHPRGRITMLDKRTFFIGGEWG